MPTSRVPSASQISIPFRARVRPGFRLCRVTVPFPAGRPAGPDCDRAELRSGPIQRGTVDCTALTGPPERVRVRNAAVVVGSVSGRPSRTAQSAAGRVAVIEAGAAELQGRPVGERTLSVVSQA